MTGSSRPTFLRGDKFLYGGSSHPGDSVGARLIKLYKTVQSVVRNVVTLPFFPPLGEFGTRYS